MPNPYPKELRERAVRAYESRTDTYQDVAARFAIGPATLMRWVQRQRDTGAVDALVKGGGWTSPVDPRLLGRSIAWLDGRSLVCEPAWCGGRQGTPLPTRTGHDGREGAAGR